MDLKLNLERVKPYLGRVICTALGLAVAVSFLVLGFLKTALILVCCGVGYAIGTYKDKGIRLAGKLRFWRDRW